MVTVKRKPKHRMLWVILLLVLVPAALVLYGLVDPSSTNLLPKCPLYTITNWVFAGHGLQCPGCGLQRCLHALLCGDIAAAFRFNALFFIILPYIICAILTEIFPDKLPRMYKALNGKVAVNLVMVLALGWMLVRNIIGI